ncbi:MAG: YwqG family protein [Phycisphaerales bacterium]
MRENPPGLVRPRRDRLLDLFREAGYSNLLDEIEPIIRSAIQITPEPVGDERIPVGSSKFGGDPDLPDGFDWPTATSGPLAFIAQIDLAVASRADESFLLPTDGLLSFFHRDWWGDSCPEGGFGVALTTAGTPLIRRPAPDGIENLVANGHGRWRACGLRFDSIASIPTWDDLGAQGHSSLSDAVYNLLIPISGEQGCRHTPLNQMLGHAHPIQHSIDVQAGGVADASNWIPLLQLDTDDRPGWMWGDMGMIYFMIRRQDLSRADFSNVQCIAEW